MDTLPAPLPLFVILPMLFTAAVESVMPAAVALSFFSTRSPVPVTPPDKVSNAVLLFLSVVSAAFTVSAPLTSSAEVALFALIWVTFEPTAALMDTLPAPVPLFVILPVLFTAAVESTRPAAVAPLFASTRSVVPVTPPLRVRTPVLSFLNVVDAPLTVMMELMPTAPALLPMIALAPVTLSVPPVIVLVAMVTPVVNTFVPASVSVPPMDCCSVVPPVIAWVNVAAPAP